jgi:NADH-quinone oxidoreductase subunit I
MIIPRKTLTLWERLYLPAIWGGFKVTLKHFFRKKVTMQYPEERWVVPEGYRGAPYLVRDQDGRTKCVSCQLCEFVCPPEAIKIVAAEYPGSNVEKYPARFDLNMLRCIYCGMCEEACPEEAIFLSDVATFVVASRDEAVLPKEKLLEIGGVRPMKIRKWAGK